MWIPEEEIYYAIHGKLRFKRNTREENK